MSIQPVLIDGQWRPSQGKETFQAVNPATRESLPERYPVSTWSEIDQMLQVANRAFERCLSFSGEKFAAFLERFAERLEARKEEVVNRAHLETGLPKQPRLADVEFPRTTGQLRQAAAAARNSTWQRPVIDTKAGIRSAYGPLGPVVVFGPNNFPFAFNGAAGGDFAAAVAAGNPVIAKGHPSHPGTTKILAEEAALAAQETGMPPGFVQMIYRTSHADGAKLVSHPLVGACGYTGGRKTGLVLKEAADKVGKPIYLELSSINPVFILPGALAERGDKLAEEFAGSCLMGAGQFCTNPGLVILIAGPESDRFVEDVRARFEKAPVGTMLAEGVQSGMASSIDAIRKAGAQLLTGGEIGGGNGFCYRNTLLSVSGKAFLANAEQLQTEAFGNSSLIVIAASQDELLSVTDHLEGNLTGCIYSATGDQDEPLYAQLAPRLRQKVGRLLNDKMPTGVAVSPAMNHGGPFPATGHPGFTAVGIPASLSRFAMLQSYDAVRPHRLPAILQDKNPGGVWRCVDGQWTTADVSI